MNAAKHGLVADKVVVLQNEAPDLFDQFYNAFVEKFNPRDNAERELVRQAAVARWRLRRVWQLETTLLDMKMDEQRDLMKKTFDRADEGVRQAMAFRSLAEDSASFTLLSRYETRLSREYDRAIRALERARALSSAEPSNFHELDRAATARERFAEPEPAAEPEPVLDPITSTEPVAAEQEFPNEPETSQTTPSREARKPLILSFARPSLDNLDIKDPSVPLPDAA